jgi:hypothetical protein
MFKFHDLVDRHSQELAQLVVQENGKNIVEALADVAKGNETVEWAASLPQMAGGRVLEVCDRDFVSIESLITLYYSGFERYHVRGTQSILRGCCSNCSI